MPVKGAERGTVFLRRTRIQHDKTRMVRVVLLSAAIACGVGTR